MKKKFVSAKRKPKYTHAGQPEKYREEFADLAYRYCLLGADDSQLAEFFGVKEQTINNWKQKHPKFFESIKEGKNVADANVANSLYKQAIGYTRKIKKVVSSAGMPETVEYEEYFPPSPTSGIFWLKNRQKKNWRDKQEVEHSGNVGIASLFEKLNGKVNKL